MAENRKKFIADIYPGEQTPLDDKLGSVLFKLQGLFPDHPIWLILQSELTTEGTEEHAYSEISPDIYFHLLNRAPEIDINKKVIILIDSYGGDGRIAYRIARFFHHRSGFIAIIPQVPKVQLHFWHLGHKKFIWELMRS